MRQAPSALTATHPKRHTTNARAMFNVEHPGLNGLPDAFIQQSMTCNEHQHKRKKEPWLNPMALSTMVFADCATLSTCEGGSYATQSVILQALASDPWNFYQAKRMKQHLFALQTELRMLQRAARPASSPARSG